MGCQSSLLVEDTHTKDTTLLRKRHTLTLYIRIVVKNLYMTEEIPLIGSYTGTQIVHRSMCTSYIGLWNNIIPTVAFNLKRPADTDPLSGSLLKRVCFNMLKTSRFCYNTLSPQTPAREYLGLVFNGLKWKLYAVYVQ